MTRRMIAVDPSGPTFYNISDFVDSTRLTSTEQVFGTIPDFTIWVNTNVGDDSIPAIPDIGWEIIDYDKDFYAPNVHKYYNSGIIIYPTATPISYNSWIEIKVTGFERQMTVPIQEISFNGTDFPTEYDIIQELFSQGISHYGLVGTWDTVSNVQTGEVSWDNLGTTTYNNTNLYDILEQLKIYPGRADDDLGYPVPARFWFVKGQWIDDTAPETIGIERVLYYFSSRSLPLNPIPLTDAADGIASYVYDDFIRPASSTTLGEASKTTQPWAPLVGTWGTDGFFGYLVSGAANSCAVVEGGLTEGTINVFFPVIDIGMGLAFRVTSQPSNPWKWEGFIIIENSTNYQLLKYQAGVLNILATFSVTPLNGDLITVNMAGNVLTVSINNVPYTPVTNSFNSGAHLHGLFSASATAGRFAYFIINGVGAQYFNAVYPKDGTGITNIIAIQGPNSDPAVVQMGTNTNTSVANEADITKTLNVSVWNNATTYPNGSIIFSTDLNGGYFENLGSSGVSGGSEPTWNNTEGATTTDNTVTWTRRNWNAGGTSYQPLTNLMQIITEDGGYVQAHMDEVPKVKDSFDRVDNAFALGKAPSGQTWSVTTDEWGVVGGRAVRNSDGDLSYAYVDSGVSNCLVRVQIVPGPTVTEARLLFRYRDDHNLWYLLADTTSYKLIKRVADVETTIFTVSTTPGIDVLKIAAEGDLIRFYLNEVFQDSTTDSFNIGATKHGIGTTSSLEPQFDLFQVTQTAETIAFGFGTATDVINYNQINFGWVSNDTRHIQPVELGVLKSSAILYSAGDVFKVAIRPFAQGGAILYLVQYYYNSQLVYNSAIPVSPIPSTESPFYVQAAIYDQGASISNLTLKRFTYGVYVDQDSVDQYGPLPANKTLVKEDLDTQVKRVDYSHGFFDRHAQPQYPISITTLNEYVGGTRVIFNAVSQGIFAEVFVVPTVDIDWSNNLNHPEYDLKLGTSEIEWGDDTPAGLLLTNNLNVREDPQPPEFLQRSDFGFPDGLGNVAQGFVWPLHEEARWIEISVKAVGDFAWRSPIRFSADKVYGTVHGLSSGTPYVAKARTIDRNGNISAYGSTMAFDSHGTYGGDVSAVGNAWIQGGNSFGAPGVLGTIDNEGFTIITNNIQRVQISPSNGSVFHSASLTGAFDLWGIYSNSQRTAGTVSGMGVIGEVYVLNSDAMGSPLSGLYGNLAFLTGATPTMASYLWAAGVWGHVSNDEATLSNIAGVYGEVINVSSGYIDVAAGVTGGKVIVGGSASAGKAVSLYGVLQDLGVENWSGYFEGDVYVGGKLVGPDTSENLPIATGAIPTTGYYVPILIDYPGTIVAVHIRFYDASGEAVSDSADFDIKRIPWSSDTSVILNGGSPVSVSSATKAAITSLGSWTSVDLAQFDSIQVSLVTAPTTAVSMGISLQVKRA